MSTASPKADRNKQALPACQRCRLRKIKCDRAAPKCTGCSRSVAACVVVDPVTGERYARAYIHQLQLREAELQRVVIDGSGPDSCPVPGHAPPGRDQVPPDTAATSPADVVDDGRTPGSHTSGSSTAAAAARTGAFVGDAGELSFLKFIFSDTRWHAQKAKILHHLTERLQIPELSLPPNPAPSLDEASRLLDNYFTRFHNHHPFLLRQDIFDIFERVYNRSSQHHHHHHPSASGAAQDNFRLFMVFAISAVTRYRAGLSAEHPYGYYLTAQSYLGNVPLVGSLDSVQNLLLVARFGMYHHIGTSLWEISQFAMRQCVELGLHEQPGSADNNATTENHKRRIFWDCYVLDRYSSGVLGRPFALADSDISVPLPLEIDDAVLATYNPAMTLAEIESLQPPPSSSHQPTELSVFVLCVRLRRITSRIHAALYAARPLPHISAPAAAEGAASCTFAADPGPGPRPSTGHSTATASSYSSSSSPPVSAGHVYVQLHAFEAELEAWRRSAPTFAVPRSLYERPEWHDFMFEKDRLLLVRGALHHAPRRRGGAPPRDLLIRCLRGAVRLIGLYDGMLRARHITWTRSYFQILFTAGLSVMYCLSMGVHAAVEADGSSLGLQQSDGSAGRAQGTVEEDPLRALELCGGILRVFRREMPDAGRFAIVFEVLKDVFTTEQSSQSQPQPRPQPQAQPPQASSSTSPTYATNMPVPQPRLATGLAGSRPSMAAWDAWPTVNNTALAAAPGLMGEDTTATHRDQGLLPPLEQEQLLAWPALTDEMIEHLEVGAGEFAWGWTNLGADQWVP